MWKKIENLPEKYTKTRKMFVVKAVDILPTPNSVLKYTSDPSAVFLVSGEYARWPHEFSPTHFYELPEDYE